MAALQGRRGAVQPCKRFKEAEPQARHRATMLRAAEISTATAAEPGHNCVETVRDAQVQDGQQGLGTKKRSALGDVTNNATSSNQPLAQKVCSGLVLCRSSV